MSLQSRVILRKEDHVYIDLDTNEQLISWSRFIENFFPKFDKSIAKNCAGKGKYAGMSEQDVLDAWSEKGRIASEYGTRIHDALEVYSKEFRIAPENEDLRPMILSIMAEYKHYYQVYDEEVFALIEEGIAGTGDKTFLLNNRKDSPFDMEDFKTNIDNGIEYVPSDKVKEKWCKYPIDHLPNCNYTKYALQLSMYAYMFSKWSGRKPRKLTIRFIPPEDKLQHVKIPVPYLKMEVEALIAEYRKMKGKHPYLNSVGNTNEPIINPLLM